MTLAALLLFLTVSAAEPIIPEFGAGNCNAKAVQKLVGKKHSKAIGIRALSLSGARVLRAARSDQAVTQDYRTDRLNFELGKSGRILRITCG